MSAHMSACFILETTEWVSVTFVTLDSALKVVRNYTCWIPQLDSDFTKGSTRILSAASKATHCIKVGRTQYDLHHLLEA
jgi:hypothetical protein